LAIRKQGLGIDDHLSTILQDIFVVHCIRLCIVEPPIGVVSVRRRLGVHESTVVSSLPVGTRSVRWWQGGTRKVRWWRRLAMFLVEILAQSNHSLTREHAENRPLVLGELWGGVAAVPLQVVSQEGLDSGQAKVG